MLTQAIDFREECESLYAAFARCNDDWFDQATQFKEWTTNDVLVHLHIWNRAADWSLSDPERFDSFMTEVREAASRGEHHQVVAYQLLGAARGRALLEQWHDFYLDMTPRFEAADPEQRLKWAGPDMSASMSITARQMETWSHGQEIFDLLGEQRVEADRIKNIVVLGVMTFGWTFANRKIERPEVKPHLRLVAPSGDIWTWNEPSDTERIDGTAVDFARVVTQVRNVADTDLQRSGESAKQWMAIAQCFAGSPVAPPVPGSRFKGPGTGGVHS